MSYSTPSMLDAAMLEHRRTKAYRARLAAVLAPDSGSDADTLKRAVLLTHEQEQKAIRLAHRCLNTRFTWWHEIALQILDDIAPIEYAPPVIVVTAEPEPAPAKKTRKTKKVDIGF